MFVVWWNSQGGRYQEGLAELWTSKHQSNPVEQRRYRAAKWDLKERWLCGLGEYCKWATGTDVAQCKSWVPLQANELHLSSTSGFSKLWLTAVYYRGIQEQQAFTIDQNTVLGELCMLGNIGRGNGQATIWAGAFSRNSRLFRLDPSSGSTESCLF